MKMIDTLSEGKLDIVGDIHGEIEAYKRLLEHLGYDTDGSNPEGRQLVFVGDLVDRGPDSPAVVEQVMRLVDIGHAQCILGNHELNILLNKVKHGNEWFMKTENCDPSIMKTVGRKQKRRFLNFFEKLPLALERADLRVVHACWYNDAFDKLKDDEVTATSIKRVDDNYVARIEEKLGREEHQAKFTDEKRLSGDKIEYGGRSPAEVWPDPVMLPAHAERDVEKQMGNPIRILTSGIERKADKPFTAGGKFRFLSRVRWWDEYSDKTPVVIGHYWRRFKELDRKDAPDFGPNLFEGVKPAHWVGTNRNVYCVDFSVGAQAWARANKKSHEGFRLAALRWPENEVVFDDGHREATISE